MEKLEKLVKELISLDGVRLLDGHPQGPSKLYRVGRYSFAVEKQDAILDALFVACERLAMLEAINSFLEFSLVSSEREKILKKFSENLEEALGVDGLLVRIKGESAFSKEGTFEGELQAFFSYEASLEEGFSCEYFFPQKVELDQRRVDFLIHAARVLKCVLEKLKGKEEIQKLKHSQEEQMRLIEFQREYIKRMRNIYYMSQAMRSVYSLNSLYSIILLSLVSDRGFDFDRAALFTREKERHVLVGVAWLGGEDEKEQEEFKRRLKSKSLRYTDAVQFLREEAVTLPLENTLTERIKGRLIYYRGHPIFERVVLRKSVLRISKRVIKTLGYDAEDILNVIDAEEFAVFPLVGRWDTLGVVIVDNKFTGRELTDLDLDSLKLFSESAGLALEGVINYEELKKNALDLQRQRDLVEYLRNFSESILESLDSAVIVLNSEGRIVEWNKKAEELFNNRKEALLGKRFRDLGENFEEISYIAENSLEKLEKISLSFYKFGERYFNLKFTPFRDLKTQRVEGIIITVDDVTEVYRMEEDRRRKEKLSTLGEMAAKVAHEIRNPLTVIGGFVKRMRKHLNDEETLKRYIDIVLDELMRLERIVQDILNFSREKEIAEFSNFDLNELVREVFVLFEGKFLEKRIDVSFNTNNARIEVVGDKVALKQVFINLIQNAIEATGDNGKIIVTTEDLGEKVRVKVWNAGPTIPLEIREKIFLPFFTTKTQGTGLGLAICKKIVEDRHKGRIWVEDVEKGALFVFELPKKPG